MGAMHPDRGQRVTVHLMTLDCMPPQVPSVRCLSIPQGQEIVEGGPPPDQGTVSRETALLEADESGLVRQRRLIRVVSATRHHAHES